MGEKQYRFSDILKNPRPAWHDQEARNTQETTKFELSPRSRRALIPLFGAFIAFVLLIFIAAIVVNALYPTAGFGYVGGMRYPYFFPFGFFFFVFFIFLIARFAFFPWGWGYRSGRWHHRDEAGEILRERYARGEITKDQFEQMSKDLEQHH